MRTETSFKELNLVVFFCRRWMVVSGGSCGFGEKIILF